MLKIYYFELKVLRWQYDLDRLANSGWENAAQGFVASHDLAQALRQHSRHQFSSEANG
jgi:hypothetical protein